MTLRYAKSVKGQCDMCYNLLQLNVTGIFLLCRLTLLLSIPWTIITRSLQKALTGHAPADYIRSMRLQYAAQLLREKDCSITEISDDSGFSDVRYFREVFRKYYGMSPSEYRNSMRG
jgi:hypothetical protein